MKFSSILSLIAARLFEPASEATADCEIWRYDPLAHPALSQMSARELADLPFERCWRSGLPCEKVCST